MTRWEYRHECATHALRKPGLDRIGKDGWELASSTLQMIGPTPQFHYIFKRPVEGEAEVEGE